MKKNNKIIELKAQSTFWPSTNCPNWQQIKKTLDQLPAGWKQDLAKSLKITPSGVSKLLHASNDPRYDQVLICIDYLASKGLDPQ